MQIIILVVDNKTDSAFMLDCPLPDAFNRVPGFVKTSFEGQLVLLFSVLEPGISEKVEVFA